MVLALVCELFQLSILLQFLTYYISHIDWHLQAGLAIVFAEDTPGIAAHDVNTSKWRFRSTSLFHLSECFPAAWNDLCPLYDALTPDQL